MNYRVKGEYVFFLFHGFHYNYSQKRRLTLLHILVGSMLGCTCCKRELAIHWSHIDRNAAAAVAAAVVAVDCHRKGSTGPTD